MFQSESVGSGGGGLSLGLAICLYVRINWLFARNCQRSCKNYVLFFGEMSPNVLEPEILGSGLGGVSFGFLDSLFLLSLPIINSLFLIMHGRLTLSLFRLSRPY